MLSSIHPLGERARNQRFWVTVGWYLAGSLLGGTLVGVVGGTIGSLLPAGSWRMLAATAVGLAGATLDLVERRPPSVRRQVDENWLGRYRGWVYGFGFGLQLGAGVVTIVTTAAVYTTLAMTLIVGSPLYGAGLGAIFGIARAVVILSARNAEDHQSLRTLMRGLQRGRPRAKALVVASQLLLAVVGLAAIL